MAETKFGTLVIKFSVFPVRNMFFTVNEKTQVGKYPLIVKKELGLTRK